MLDSNTVALLNQFGIPADTFEVAVVGVLWLTVVMIVTAIPTAIVAKRKERSVVGWVILALTIPVLPLIFVWLLPKRVVE